MTNKTIILLKNLYTIDFLTHRFKINTENLKFFLQLLFLKPKSTTLRLYALQEGRRGLQSGRRRSQPTSASRIGTAEENTPLDVSVDPTVASVGRV